MTLFHDTTNKIARKMNLSPTGPIRRSSPALQAELGDEDAADLLLQIDYWITTEPCDQLGLWIHKSASDMQPAFPTWSVRKMQRKIADLAARQFIHVVFRDSPHSTTTTPYIALNLAIIQNIRSVTARAIPELYPDYEQQITRHTINNTIVGHNQRNVTPVTYVTPVIILSPPQAPPFDPPLCHPCRSPMSPMSQPCDTHDAALYIYKESLKDQDQERSGDHADPPSPDPSPDAANAAPDELTQVLADICNMDIALNRGRLRKRAAQLSQAGYTITDLLNFESWWQAHDWRGRKSESPTPERVIELIAQSTKRSGSRSYLSGPYSHLIET